MKLIPFFYLNKVRYEIKPTRYLALQYEKISEENSLSNDDKVNALKLQNMAVQVRELAEQLKALKEEYYADMTNKEAKAQYRACKEEYNEMFEELARFEAESGGLVKVQKAGIDALEQIAILGLAEQYYGYGKDEIYRREDYEKGKEIWESFVDTIGIDKASEWLVAMSENLFGEDEEEEENPFLAQVKAKRAERAENQKKGLKKIKR